MRRRAFIAAVPRMIFDQTETKRGGLAQNIGVFIRCGVFRTCQSGFNECFVKNTDSGFFKHAHQTEMQFDGIEISQINEGFSRQVALAPYKPLDFSLKSALKFPLTGATEK